MGIWALMNSWLCCKWLYLIDLFFWSWHRWIDVWLSFLNGAKNQWACIEQGLETQKVVQKKLIILRNRVLPIPKYYSYISTHISFISLNELMSRPISLHCISLQQQKAYFVELPSGANPFNIRSFSILFVSQRELASHLYVVSLDQFYQYVSTLDVDGRSIVWLLHSARCGSTVWSQIFNTLPNWGVISESNFLLHSILYENDADSVDLFLQSTKFQRLAVTGFKFNLSRFPASHSVFIKGATFQDLSLLRVIRKHFDIKLLFSYRNCLPSARSWTQAFRRYKNLFPEAGRKVRNGSYINDYLTLFTHHSHVQSWLDSESIKISKHIIPSNQFEWYLMYWCSTVNAVMQAQKQGFKISCIKYEDLETDCVGIINKAFKHLAIDSALVAKALKSMETDSHADTYFSRDQRKHLNIDAVPFESLAKGNQILAAYGFPALGSNFVLPHTL